MLYKSFLNDTILIQTQAVDGYLWLLVFLFLFAIFGLNVFLIVFYGAFKNTRKQRKTILVSKTPLPNKIVRVYPKN